MSLEPTLPVERTFLSVAGEQGFLSATAMVELAAAAERQKSAPATLALQRGLMDAIQVDIVETLLRPGEAIPGYEILGLLGRGGMGVVYRARQLSLARVVALKTVLVSELGQEAALPRFEQEARSVARLAHPHIIAAYDFGAYQGRVYFAMELVPGEDVERLVERTGPLDEYTAWGLARQAAAGLAHAAEQGIVHRDIKPANLLLVEPPAGFELPPGLPLLKIADFGLARLQTANSERARLTATNVAVGSPRYMSPEQFRGQMSDHRADIFALGASVFHMLAGRPPLGEKSLPEIVAARLEGRQERVGDLGAHVAAETEALLAAMTATDPAQRVSDYRELMARIDALPMQPRRAARVHLQATQPTSVSTITTRTGTEPTQVVPKALPPRRLFGWLVGCMVAALLGLVALPWLFTGNKAGERDLAPTGRVVDLFNGQNMQAWHVVSGGWNPARNNEKAMVLQGSGVIQRPLALVGLSDAPEPLAYFRLNFVVEFHEASAVELWFDLDPNDAAGRAWCLHIDRAQSTLQPFAENSATAGRIVGSAPLAATANSLHAVRLERHSGGWWAFVDEQLVGSGPLLHERPAPEVQLAAVGGNAWFSDFTCEELAASAQTEK